MELKQVILIRQDLKMPRGKMAVQTCHASVEAALRSDVPVLQEWRKQGMKKILLKVKDKKELLMYNQWAKDKGFTTALITDAGKTYFDTSTTTCLAIGPDGEEKLDILTGELKLL
ncbi:MAG TPA: peptidyl-tRNA hydrolase Pth2 [Candidatus Nanoarchaeia archaeon]|nr:peptidyl-tRNA hydrolase Pth2 [Candidatus Nanoarchaeia archaeon]